MLNSAWKRAGVVLLCGWGVGTMLGFAASNVANGDWVLVPLELGLGAWVAASGHRLWKTLPGGSRA